MVFLSHSFFSILARFPPVSKERQIPGGAPEEHRRSTDLPKMQVDLAPHRHRLRKNTRCIHTPALILAMQPHGGKSCPCGCIARFLHLRFLPLKLVHQHKHDAGKKIPFFPPHLSFIPLISAALYFTPNAHSPPLPLTIPTRGSPAL